MNYIVRKGIPNFYRTTDKRKQGRVSVGETTEGSEKHAMSAK